MKHQPKIVTLYPSKRRILFSCTICLIFIGFGIWMLSEGRSKGWFVVTFFSLGFLVFVLSFLPQSTYLRLSEQGLEVRSLFRSGFLAWKDVGPFQAGYIRARKTVVFNFSPEHGKSKVGKVIARGLTGYEGTLPDTYGKSVEELVALLNEWRSEFSHDKR